MNNKLKNKIFDDMLEYAVKEEFETVMNNMPKDEKLEEYIPSKEFDLKMKNTIKRYTRKQKINKIMNISKKVAIWGIAIFVISMGALLSVEASRQYILNMFIEFRKGNILISHKDEVNKSESDKIFKPKYIPNGYQEGEVIERRFFDDFINKG